VGRHTCLGRRLGAQFPDDVSAIASVSFTHSLISYALLLSGELFLPAALTGSVTFPLSVTELYFRRSVYCFYTMGTFLLLSLPLWVRGYNISMEAVGRQVRITPAECAIKLLYQTCQSASVMQLVIPLVVLQTHLGAPYHIIHLLGGVVEMLLINVVVSLKFCVVHQLAHEVRPLYAMAHVEHHVCKTIHATTSSAGIWEFYLMGGSITFSAAIMAVPYLMLQVRASDSPSLSIPGVRRRRASNQFGLPQVFTPPCSKDLE